MKPDPPEGAIPRLPRRLPGLAQRLPRRAATAPSGPSLELTVRYHGRRHSAEICDPSAGLTWRCPHSHPSHASASRCVGVMARRINRLGWQRATGQRRRIQRARGQSS